MEIPAASSTAKKSSMRKLNVGFVGAGWMGGTQLRRLSERSDVNVVRLAEPNAERARELLLDIRRHGLRTSIDDYGTGFSSLSYLRDLPLSELKMDRSFVASVHSDPRSRLIVASTINMAYGEVQKKVLFRLMRDAEQHEIKGKRVGIGVVNINKHVELAMVVQLYAKIVNADAVFVVLVNESGGYFVIGRSGTPEINVNAVLQRFGGGGHGKTLVELVQLIIQGLLGQQKSLQINQVYQNLEWG